MSLDERVFYRFAAALIVLGLVGLLVLIRDLRRRTRTPAGTRLQECLSLARGMREHGHPFEARRAFLIAQMNLSGAAADRILAKVEEAEGRRLADPFASTTRPAARER